MTPIWMKWASILGAVLALAVYGAFWLWVLWPDSPPATARPATTPQPLDSSRVSTWCDPDRGHLIYLVRGGRGRNGVAVVPGGCR